MGSLVSLVTAGVLALGCATAASGADLGRPIHKAPVGAAPIAYNWSGFYIGGHVGGAWSGSDDSFANGATAGGILFMPVNLPFDTGGNGFVAGGQIGYNWQFAHNWVIGIEADLSWTDVNGSTTYSPIPPGPTGAAAVAPSFVTMSRDVNWLATVRGRLGYAWDRVLVYGTGGVAWSNADYFGIESRAGGVNIDVASFSSTRVGWVLGGGVEYALSQNWTIRGEYLFYSTDGVSALATAIPSLGALNPTVTFDWDRTNLHVLRFGINYKFGGGPIVANY